MRYKANLRFSYHSICALAVLTFVNSSVLSKAQTGSNSKEHKSLSNGFNLGDSTGAVEDLGKIYQLLIKYRYRNGGMPPNTPVALLQDLMKSPQSYGFKDYEETLPVFSNPDSVYAGVPDADIYVAYPVTNKRPDGSPLGSPKEVGTHDLWSYTSIYYHPNATRSANGINNPIGFYVVLWDNGEVEKIPYDLVFSIPSGGYLRRPFFPNQAGISYDGITYAERFLELTGNEDIPVGKPTLEDGSVVKDNGGVEGLVQLSRRLSYPTMYGVGRDKLWELFDSAKPEFILADIKPSAKKLGLETQVAKQTLPDLQKSGTPALLFLQDDGRIVTLTAIDDDRAVVIDRGLTQNVERSVLEKRYSGEALVPTKALTQNAAIVADDAVREVKLPSLEAEVPQQFVLRNTGTTPITLQLEYPLLGVTESKLSQDTLAPGETATLDLKVKWRSILKAPYQNVLVSLQTNDPIVPRLQLAILLTPPGTTAN